jgi:3-phenylpropionate/cinnamic acid dioxygenase small subunit
MASETVASVTTVSVETQREVEQFLYRQAEILDERRWDDWLGLFTPDGHYWMPADPSHSSGEGVPSIFYEDQYMMRVRAGRLEHPRAWSQSPRNRTNHVVSNVIIEHEEPETGELSVRAKFIMVEFRLDEQRYFTGTYRHHLVPTPAGLRIRLQRVDLLNYDGPYDYVLQSWV